MVVPEHQAVIAEASGEARLGRGLGWYESAALAGALIGTAAAGMLYELGSWRGDCGAAKLTQISCGAEKRATGLLVATSKARRPDRILGFHDAVRFAGQENLTEYHPAFAVSPIADDAEPSQVDEHVTAVLVETVGLFVSEGWDGVLVADCVEHVAYRLGDLASRATAIESLRRDRAVPVLLRLPPLLGRESRCSYPQAEFAEMAESCGRTPIRDFMCEGERNSSRPLAHTNEMDLYQVLIVQIKVHFVSCVVGYAASALL